MSSKYEGLEFLVGIGSYNKTTCNNSYITKFDNVKVFNNYRNCSGSITIPQHQDALPGGIWKQMIEQVKTPYILVGRNINGFHKEWANLERSIRLLGDESIMAVGGAGQNSTGNQTELLFWKKCIPFYRK